MNRLRTYDHARMKVQFAFWERRGNVIHLRFKTYPMSKYKVS